MDVTTIPAPVAPLTSLRDPTPRNDTVAATLRAPDPNAADARLAAGMEADRNTKVLHAAVPTRSPEEAAFRAKENLEFTAQLAGVASRTLSRDMSAASVLDFTYKTVATQNAFRRAEFKSFTQSESPRTFSGGLSLDDFTNAPQKTKPGYSALDALFTSTHEAGKRPAPLLRFGRAMSMDGLGFASLALTPRDASFLEVHVEDPFAAAAKKSVAGAAALTLTPTGQLTYQQPVVMQEAMQPRRDEAPVRKPAQPHASSVGPSPAMSTR